MNLADEVLGDERIDVLCTELDIDYETARIPLLIDENGNLPANNAEEVADEVTDEAEDVTPEVNVD